MSCCQRTMALVLVSVAAIACNSGNAEVPHVHSLFKPSTLHEEPQPRTLEEALATLERAASGEFLARMRGDDEDLAGSFHMGVGMWIRNNWGLWQQGPLYHDLARHGLQHPDDMSGVILTSFWRRQHGRPIAMEEQVRKYQQFWEASRQLMASEAEKFKVARAKLRSMMMGLTLDSATDPARVRLRTRTTEGLQARYFAKYGDGVIVGARQHVGDHETYRLQPYFLDRAHNTLRPIQLPELDVIWSAVVLGDSAWFVGSTKAGPVLMTIASSHGRRAVALPRSREMPQLGSFGTELLAVYTDAIYRLDGDHWRALVEGVKLPRSGPPPFAAGGRIYLRDEGTHESDKQLWWIDLSAAAKLVSLTDDLGVARAFGPYWSDSPSYAVAPSGSLWVTVGNIIAGWSLLERTSTGAYRAAIVNGRLTYDGRWLGGAEEQPLRISAVAFESGGALIAAGKSGLYRLVSERLVALALFKNTEQQIPLDDGLLQWSWQPSHLLALGGNKYLIGGMFGGIYAATTRPGVSVRLRAVDETIGPPVGF